MAVEHPLVQLARQTIESYVRLRRSVEPPADLTPEMREKAGVFVSLHERGELRGCIGTFGPTAPNVAQEIIQNAISSATRDPRFPPVTVAELPHLEINVDVLTAPEAIDGPDDLDPKRYGVIVESGRRRGLLLPDLDGVDTVAYQIEIAKRKAGIGLHEPVKLYRFEVRRFR
jgi:AmmeMemoRadiSam system protein A